jgi:hypothetical protein
MMPMYYFHIRDGSTLEIDPDGTELPDAGAAHAEALKVAHDRRQLSKLQMNTAEQS